MKRSILWIFLLCVGVVALPYLANSPPNLDKVLESQRERVSSDPRNPAAWNDLGNLLTLEDRFSEAEQAYREALALSPTDTSIRFNLALLLHQDGRLENAESELRQIVRFDPHHAWAHYQLGVLIAGNDRSTALDHYARALAYDPKLSFSENNPHILDNSLFSEALLRSQKYLVSSAARVPRQYSEPDRIVNLMLEEERAKEDADGEELGEKDEDDEARGEDDEARGEDDEARDQRGGALPSRGTSKSRAPHAGKNTVGKNTAGKNTAGKNTAGKNTAGKKTAGKNTGGLRAEGSSPGSRPLPGTTVNRLKSAESSRELTRRQVAEQERAEREAGDSRKGRVPSTDRSTSSGARTTTRTPLTQSPPSLRQTPPSLRQTPPSLRQTPPPSASNPPPPDRRPPPRVRGGGSRYIPGSSSTSRLELKLLPEVHKPRANPTRYASLEPAPGR